MMKVKIKEIAERQGIENAKQLAKLTGLSVTSCYQLWNQTAKAISFESLNTLCNVLQAGPAVLFDYTPDVAPQGTEPQGNRETTGRHTSGPGKKRLPKVRSLGAGAGL